MSLMVVLIPIKKKGSALLLLMPMISTPSATPVYHGHQGASKTSDIPNGRVGVLNW